MSNLAANKKISLRAGCEGFSDYVLLQPTIKPTIQIAKGIVTKAIPMKSM